MENAVAAPGFRPLYQQVKDLLRQRIVDGAWAPGQVLPSEQRLAAELGVSQGTVRKALDELAAENVLVRHQGRGTFVAEHTAERSLFHFFHLVDRAGERRRPTSEVLDARRGVAGTREQETLRLQAGAVVLRIARLRLLDGRPAIVEHITVPAALFPDLGSDPANPLPNTLYDLYQRRYGVTIARAVEHLRAVAATPEEARHLGLAPGAPLLEIDRVALTLAGEPVEWRLSRVATRDVSYRVELD